MWVVLIVHHLNYVTGKFLCDLIPFYASSVPVSV
jgi:hypothetical protein